jgi:hypothetical protein
MNTDYSFNRLIFDYKSKYKVSVRRIGGAKQDRTADLLRARQALSQLSYSPIFRWLCYQIHFSSLEQLEFCVTKFWWVWVDSNHRPHPYQGCALTT